jgi:hypothetical protein
MIDSGLPSDDWDQEVVEAAARFDLGDLVKSPPLFYAAVPSRGIWGPTPLLADQVEAGEEAVIEVDEEERPPFGIITSPGCDVDDIRRKPWVQVAPVYESSAVYSSQMADVRRDAVPHLVLLEPPDLDGTWVADLRLEVPVEKSWLAGRDPIAAFGSDEGRRHFARRVSGRTERPALPQTVHDLVVRPLRRWLNRAGTQVQALLGEAGVEFRMRIREDDDGGVSCEILVIGRRGPIPPSIVERIDTWWDGIPRDADQPVVLLGCRYGTSDEFTMSEYLGSVLLDDSFLGEDADIA